MTGNLGGLSARFPPAVLQTDVIGDFARRVFFRFGKVTA